MQYHLRYCPDCLADQETGEEGPCTDCSSIRVAGVTYNPGTVVPGNGDAYTEYGTARPWQEQWYLAKVHFKELMAAYQPGSYRGDAVAKAAVESFFDHCLRVHDWVKGDAMTTKRGKNKLETSSKTTPR